MFRAATFLTPVSLRRLGLAALACSALTLVGCGGGSRAKDYHPDSIVVFGDENSAFVTYTPTTYTGGVQGLVYTVNPVVYDEFVYCPDTTSSTTRCDTSSTSNLLTGVGTSFVPTSPTYDNYPHGKVFRLGNETKSYETSWIALGQGNTTASPTTLVPMKQSFMLTYDCSASSTVMQFVAHAFGKGYKSNCSFDNDGATTYAQLDATVAMVQTQVNNNLAGLGSGTLVIVWAGQQDVKYVYESPTWGTLDAKRAEVKYRADALASAIKQILNTGAKVLVIGVPDLGFSPYGRGKYTAQGSSLACQNATRTDSSVISDCNGDLETLAKDFNNTLVLGDQGLGLSGLQDYVYKGRQYAYVDAWALTQSYALNASYVNDAVCDSTKLYTPDGSVDSSSRVQFCTNAFSIKSSASTSTYLWADDGGTHPSSVLHSAIGSQAYNQAANQF